MSRIKLSHQFALIKRSQTQILLIVALATLGACAPLAEVRQINPELGAQHGTPPQLHGAEQSIAYAEDFKRTNPEKAVGFYLSGVESTTSGRAPSCNPKSSSSNDSATVRSA